MNLETRRLFIPNLPENISQRDLEKKFSNYGKITSTEIKNRKNILPNQTPKFAYIELNIENTALEICLNEFSHQKWKGHLICLQLAKESFMERLKRERKELHKNEVSNSYLVNDTASINETNLSSTNNEIIHNDFKKYSSNSSSKEKYSQIDANEIGKQNSLKKSIKLTVDLSEEESTTKNNKKEVKSSGLQEEQANKRRLQSILQMKKDYKNQKHLIQKALSNIDLKPNNKIVFEDSDLNQVASKKRKSKSIMVNEDIPTRQKLVLFEENEDQNDANIRYNFDIKEQFEGLKGRKLMELQSRFKNDKRFDMDARFLDEFEEENNDEELNTQHNNNPTEFALEEEKNKQFEILEEVLGRKVSRMPSNVESNTRNSHKMMLRFDPSQPEHSKYEVLEPKKVKNLVKQGNSFDKKVKTNVHESESKPEVSKETFYKVSVNLKETLNESQNFNLTDLFNKEILSDEHPVKQTKEPKNQLTSIRKKNEMEPESNPFKYDSSCDEDEKEPTNIKQITNTKLQRNKPARLWSEPFFFKNDDYRLQEGLDFIKRLQVEDAGDFFNIRRSLKQIVRAKVKNNQRKNRPFKRKLGSKKRIVVKRALKR